MATVCRSELAVAVGMVSGVVKWMDAKTKARFRSNDWQPIHYSACISWQEFCGLSTDAVPEGPALLVPAYARPIT